jgi:hypothetical protein
MNSIKRHPTDCNEDSGIFMIVDWVDDQDDDDRHEDDRNVDQDDDDDARLARFDAYARRNRPYTPLRSDWIGEPDLHDLPEVAEPCSSDPPHTHTWEPVPNWCARYRCAMCGAFGVKNRIVAVRPDGTLHVDRGIKPFRCGITCNGRRCGRPAVAKEGGTVWRCRDHRRPPLKRSRK